MPADVPKASTIVLTPSATTQTASESISTAAFASHALPLLNDSLVLSHRLSAVPAHGAIAQDMQAAIGRLDPAVVDVLAQNLLA